MRTSRFLVLGLALFSASAFANPPFYRITYLGSLGGDYTRGIAMNNAGQVTGQAETNLLTVGNECCRVHVFLWDGTTLRDLGAGGNDFGSGRAINASGQVTGTVHSFTTQSETAFLWDGSSMRFLGSTSGAIAINNSGQVAATTGCTNSDPCEALLWNGTTVKRLGTLGGDNSSATDINGAGQVTGNAEIADSRAQHAFLWNGTTMQDSSTTQLIFGVDALVAFLSETVTLEPGDVVATGTPAGVGFARTPPVYLKPGDIMEVEVEGLGILSNPVLAEGVS